jgi:hypothetical protein
LRLEPIALPTTLARHRGGVVRWDLPLRTTADLIGQTVFVECDCGRKRHVLVSEVLRWGRRSRATCPQCSRLERRDGSKV